MIDSPTFENVKKVHGICSTFIFSVRVENSSEGQTLPSVDEEDDINVGLDNIHINMETPEGLLMNIMTYYMYVLLIIICDLV